MIHNHEVPSSILGPATSLKDVSELDVWYILFYFSAVEDAADLTIQMVSDNFRCLTVRDSGCYV